MALRKEFKSKSGVTGDYMAVHAISYDNEKKTAAYSVALYLNEASKREGAEPLTIIYQGRLEQTIPENLIGQCYADMKAKAEAIRTVEIPAFGDVEAQTKEAPAFPTEWEMFNGAEDV